MHKESLAELSNTSLPDLIPRSSRRTQSRNRKNGSPGQSGGWQWGFSGNLLESTRCSIFFLVGGYENLQRYRCKAFGSSLSSWLRSCPYSCNIGPGKTSPSPANAMLIPYSSGFEGLNWKLSPVTDEFTGMKIFMGIACRPLVRSSRFDVNIFCNVRVNSNNNNFRRTFQRY